MQFFEQGDGLRGFVGAVIVHDQIDWLTRRQSGFVPDLLKKHSHADLVSRLVELVDEAARHAVADAAEDSYAREAGARNCDSDRAAPGHVGRGWLGSGVHRSLVDVAERDLVLDQLRKLDYERQSVLQPRGGPDMLIPVAGTPQGGSIACVELPKSRMMYFDVEFFLNFAHFLLK